MYVPAISKDLEVCDSSTFLWLHADHGRRGQRLGELVLPARGTYASVAEAFAASIEAKSNEGDFNTLGVPCQISGVHLHATAEEGSSDGNGAKGTLLANLFLSELSCVSFPTPSCRDMLLLTIAPPVGGIKGTSIANPSASTSEKRGWALFYKGSMRCQKLLDKLGKIGCLRQDLEAAYQSSDGTRMLGEGTYATVHIATCYDGTKAAVKKMHSTIEIEGLEREVATLIHVQPQKHIIGFRGIFWNIASDVAQMSLVFDVATRGDLLACVVRGGALTEAAGKPLFVAVMDGIAHIHAHDIVHRDIKAENILLMQEEHPVIADFGLACWSTDAAQMARRCGSPGYVSPEVCLGTSYSFKVDVFGAGIVLYFMLSEEMPFSSSDRDTATTMRRTVKCNLHLHKPPWDTMGSRLRNALRQTICKDVDERLSAKDVLQHPWLASITSVSAKVSAQTSLPAIPVSTRLSSNGLTYGGEGGDSISLPGAPRPPAEDVAASPVHAGRPGPKGDTAPLPTPSDNKVGGMQGPASPVSQAPSTDAVPQPPPSASKPPHRMFQASRASALASASGAAGAASGGAVSVSAPGADSSGSSPAHDGGGKAELAGTELLRGFGGGVGRDWYGARLGSYQMGAKPPKHGEPPDYSNCAPPARRPGGLPSHATQRDRVERGYPANGADSVPLAPRERQQP